MTRPVWTKDAYEASVTSRCWWFTPYGDGWEASRRHGADLSADEELRDIVAMEHALGRVPDWAEQIVETPINFLPPCGHYLFPLAYLEAVSAIGAQEPPSFIHGCYTVERGRKERMQNYLLCLDAWLAGADPSAAAGELTVKGASQVDWPVVCRDLWQVLGERTETKDLLVERALHRQRWWLKSMVWDDDARDVFCRDEYLGDVHCDGDSCGNPDFCDPYFSEQRSPRVRWVEERLAAICPSWAWFEAAVRDSWLCAPKACRFLERLLWSIGKGRPAVSLPDHPVEEPEEAPGFLQCEDTYPNVDATAQWWDAFLCALRAWWRGEARTGDVAVDVDKRLGRPTPVKRWLVRLLVRKLELHEREQLAALITPHSGTKRGTRPSV
jgi:hypothetical protein